MFAKPILNWFRNQDDQKWPIVMARALPQSEAMFQSLFHPCTGSQRRTLIFEAREKCPRRVPATSWHSSSLSWSSARFSGYQKHHKLYCMHSTAIAGGYSCCRHQCWGWSSHPQQPANRHGQDIAYDRRQLPPPTRCAEFFLAWKEVNHAFHCPTEISFHYFR